MKADLYTWENALQEKFIKLDKFIAIRSNAKPRGHESDTSIIEKYMTKVGNPVVRNQNRCTAIYKNTEIQFCHLMSVFMSCELIDGMQSIMDKVSVVENQILTDMQSPSKKNNRAKRAQLCYKLDMIKKIRPIFDRIKYLMYNLDPCEPYNAVYNDIYTAFHLFLIWSDLWNPDYLDRWSPQDPFQPCYHVPFYIFKAIGPVDMVNMINLHRYDYNPVFKFKNSSVEWNMKPNEQYDPDLKMCNLSRHLEKVIDKDNLKDFIMCAVRSAYVKLESADYGYILPTLPYENDLPILIFVHGQKYKLVLITINDSFDAGHSITCVKIPSGVGRWYYWDEAYGLRIYENRLLNQFNDYIYTVEEFLHDIAPGMSILLYHRDNSE